MKKILLVDLDDTLLDFRKTSDEAIVSVFNYHNIPVSKENLDKYDTLNPAGKMLFAKGSRYEGQPIIFSEFGGVMMRQKSDDGSWGYGKNADDKEEFYQRIDNLVKGIYTCPFQGYCYTQVSDVQQEKNGLLDENHEPKFSIERLAEIFGRDGK